MAVLRLEATHWFWKEGSRSDTFPNEVVGNDHEHFTNWETFNVNFEDIFSYYAPRCSSWWHFFVYDCKGAEDVNRERERDALKSGTKTNKIPIIIKSSLQIYIMNISNWTDLKTFVHFNTSNDSTMCYHCHNDNVRSVSKLCFTLHSVL